MVKNKNSRSATYKMGITTTVGVNFRIIKQLAKNSTIKNIYFHTSKYNSDYIYHKID